jgi:hypothetical protein
MQSMQYDTSTGAFYTSCTHCMLAFARRVGGFASLSPSVRCYGGPGNCVAMSGESDVELPTDDAPESSRLLEYDRNIGTSCPPASDGSSDDGCVQNPYSELYRPEALNLMPSELPPFLQDRIYSFCRRTTVAVLRKMAKRLGVPTTGAKSMLSATVFYGALREISTLPD